MIVQIKHKVFRVLRGIFSKIPLSLFFNIMRASAIGAAERSAGCGAFETTTAVLLIDAGLGARNQAHIIIASEFLIVPHIVCRCGGIIKRPDFG